MYVALGQISDWAWYAVRNIPFGHFVGWMMTTARGARLVSGRGYVLRQSGVPVGLTTSGWAWHQLRCSGVFGAWAYMNAKTARTIARGDGEARTIVGKNVQPTMLEMIC